MKKEEIIATKNDIEMYKKKLRELEPYIEDDEAMAILYNQTIVDKAVSIHKLQEQVKTKKTMDELKKIFTFNKRQRKICDYFMK